MKLPSRFLSPAPAAMAPCSPPPAGLHPAGGRFFGTKLESPHVEQPCECVHRRAGAGERLDGAATRARSDRQTRLASASQVDLAQRPGVAHREHPAAHFRPRRGRLVQCSECAPRRRRRSPRLRRRAEKLRRGSKARHRRHRRRGDDGEVVPLHERRGDAPRAPRSSPPSARSC